MSGATVCPRCGAVAETDLGLICPHEAWGGEACGYAWRQAGWYLPGDATVEQVSRLHWTVSRGGREVADIYGGGPTTATQYKVVTARDAHMNPDSAPGGYWSGLGRAVRDLLGVEHPVT